MWFWLKSSIKSNKLIYLLYSKGTVHWNTCAIYITNLYATNVCSDRALIADVYKQLEENNFTDRKWLVLCVGANQLHNDTVEVSMAKFARLITWVRTTKIYNIVVIARFSNYFLIFKIKSNAQSLRILLVEIPTLPKFSISDKKTIMELNAIYNQYKPNVTGIIKMETSNDHYDLKGEKLNGFGYGKVRGKSHNF